MKIADRNNVLPKLGIALFAWKRNIYYSSIGNSQEGIKIECKII
jgi:hypothetical protein